MHQPPFKPETAGDVDRYFTTVQKHSQQERLGSIVVEILCSGSVLNRAAISTALAAWMEVSASDEEKQCCLMLAALFAGRAAPGLNDV